jgi:hypothetical protein
MTQEKHEIGQIKSKTVSVTTTANGNALVDMLYSKYIIIAATAPYSSDTIVVPYRYTNQGNDYLWGVHVMASLGTLDPKQGTFDIVLYYIER